MTSFASAKLEFDKKFENKTELPSIVPIHLTLNKTTKIKDKAGRKNEEYYKWQFLYSIISSGLFEKDFIGTEVCLPKGNKNSAPIKLDAAIFDSVDWFDKYKHYYKHNDTESLDWLREHLLVAIEFKKEDVKDVEVIWNKQLKAYLKESDRDFCLLLRTALKVAMSSFYKCTTPTALLKHLLKLFLHLTSSNRFPPPS